MQAINQQRRDDKKAMQELGIKTKKAYRKYQKKQRRITRESNSSA